MHRKPRTICVVPILTAAVALACAGMTGGCGGGSASANHTDERRATRHEYLAPAASGSLVYGDDTVSIDASNLSDGYVMVRYQGNVEKVRLQMTIPDGTVYSYTLPPDIFWSFPLSGGNGSYHLDVLEHVQDDLYALIFSQDIEASLTDEFSPFLYPNQYVWFTAGDEAVTLAAELSAESSNDLDYVEQVYRYVTETITYDDALAATVTTGYLPDNARTMEKKSGICFDYASLMAAMLRSQGIPTKLVFGYSGEAYHAWISVWLAETGWVDSIIEFDGKSWSLMDPTLAAGNNRSSVKEYVGDGSRYTEKYFY